MIKKLTAFRGLDSRGVTIVEVTLAAAMASFLLTILWASVVYSKSVLGDSSNTSVASREAYGQAQALRFYRAVNDDSRWASLISRASTGNGVCFDVSDPTFLHDADSIACRSQIGSSASAAAIKYSAPNVFEARVYWLGSSATGGKTLYDVDNDGSEERARSISVKAVIR